MRPRKLDKTTKIETGKAARARQTKEEVEGDQNKWAGKRGKGDGRLAPALRGYHFQKLAILENTTK